jgi:hypothetical protein
METDDQEPRVDRSALSVVDLHDSSDDQYWWSRTPEERLEATEINRQIVYGYGPTHARLQRVFEVVGRSEEDA